MQYLMESDILLLINGEADYNNIFIPGKLFDYLAVRKPILFIGKGQPVDIINELNIGESARHNPKEIKEKLKAMIDSINNYKPNEDLLLKYHAKNVTKFLVDIFTEIYNGNNY